MVLGVITKPEGGVDKNGNKHDRAFIPGVIQKALMTQDFKMRLVPYKEGYKGYEVIFSGKSACKNTTRCSPVSVAQEVHVKIVATGLAKFRRMLSCAREDERKQVLVYTAGWSISCCQSSKPKQT